MAVGGASVAVGGRSVKNPSNFFQVDSLEIKRKAGDSIGQALALVNLARMRAKEGKLEEALDHTRLAIEIFEHPLRLRERSRAPQPVRFA